mgnify:CR=1 FL=1
MSKSRIFLFILLAFSAGVGVRSFVFVPHALVWAVGIGAVTVFTLGVLRARQDTWVIGLCLIVLLTGIFRFDVNERDRPDVSAWQGKNVEARGIVWEAPRRDGAVQRLKIKTRMVDGVPVDEPFFVMATLRPNPRYYIGDAILFEGVIEMPENFSDFDYISYLARDDIFLVTTFPRAEKIGQDETWRLAVVLAGIKDAFESNIDNALPEPHAAFMKGLLLGERASLPEELIENFRIAGVSHVVALSGYNITIVGASLMSVLLWMTVPFVVSFRIAIGTITLFILMTGAAASVVRAGIMGVLVLVAKKEGRPYHMTNTLAFAAAAMVFHSPYILRFDAGFQLSFLATAGILYLSPHVERWTDRIVRAKKESYGWGLSVRKIFIETMSAQIMVLPLLIWLFGSVSLASPLANIAVLITVPYAMGAGFAAGMLGFVSPLLGTIAGWGAWVVLEYQLRAIAFFAGIPFASVGVGAWVAVPIAVILGITVWNIWKPSGNTRV